ncbi:long chain fatty acid coA ligase, putative [Leishmania tarentolae]|uniref:Long chain fatty acid coA ligase, putative n=1 Tax=Leishmania tarentolae TaxID=5689 RepID=A0A640K7X2_LEITA|nr:long chain fatty acid coA ligase, putative [Leishmania tarentolae]
MGALLVALLQCRNNQSLYPNISATQHSQNISCRQPCSVPLLGDAHSYGQQAHLHNSLMAETSATMPTDEAGDVGISGGATDADNNAAAAISHLLLARLLTTNAMPTPPSAGLLHPQLQNQAAAQSAVDDATCTSPFPTLPPLSSAGMPSSPSNTPPTQPQNCPSLPSTTVFMPSATAVTPLAPTAPLKECSNRATSPLAVVWPKASPPPPPRTHAPAGELAMSSPGALFSNGFDPLNTIVVVPGDNTVAAEVNAGDAAGCNASMEGDELGPMDCADAFQYFFDDDEHVYRDVESAVYAAPQMAHVPMPVLRDTYLNLCMALYTETSSSTLTAPSLPPRSGGSGAPAIPRMSLLGASTNVRGGAMATEAATWPPTQTSPPHEASSGLCCAPHTSLTLHDARPATTANDVAAPTPSGRHPGAGRFTSLVEEMAAACRRVGAAPFVCWRSIDRVTALPPPEAPLWGRLYNGGSGRVDNARGEAEDDTSCPPVSDAPRKRRSNPSSLPDGDGGSGIDACAPTSQQQSKSMSLYYLGPQQYMTAAVWWSRVEAFGFGLHSMGLRPGDLIGIVEDTRWEWLVTCYAAWSVGLVVVAFDGSARTMARVAMDTAPDMKALVCSPTVHRDLRRHYDAAAKVAAVAARSASTPVSTTSNDMKNYCGVEEGNSYPPQGTCASGAAAAAAWVDERGKHYRAEAAAPTPRASEEPRTKRPGAQPMFIVIRSAGPPRGGRSDGGDGHTSAPRGSASSAAASRPWWSCTSMCERPSSSQAPGVTTEAHNDGEDEEEEALWWSDVLMHGETQLKAWRQRKLRGRRLQQQARLRHLKPLQRGARAAGAGVDGNTVEASLPACAPLGRPRVCSRLGTEDLHGAAADAAASQDGSAASGTTRAIPGHTEAVSDISVTTAHTASCAANTAPILLVGDAATEEHKSGNSARFSADVAARRASVPGRERMARTEPPTRGSGGRSPGVLAAASAVSGSAHAIAAPLMAIDDGPPQWPLAPLQPDDHAFILYTEGDPKGVLLTHGAVKASVAAHHEYLNSTDVDGDDGPHRVASRGGVLTGTAAINKNRSIATETLGRGGQGDSHVARHTTAYMPALRSRTAPAGRPSYMAYLPLHDVCEFVAETASLLRGLLVCYGTRRTLFDTWARPHGDLTEYKPTIVPALPATLARLRRTVESMVSTGYRQLLFDAAYEARRQAMRRGLHTPFLLSTIFAPSRKLLGGRCRLLLARGGPGAAALHPRDQEYLQVVCGASVVQAYAVAENAGCGLHQAYCAVQLDSIGGPLGPVHVKMRDVFAAAVTASSRVDPAGGGSWTHQSERPTGELLLRGPTVMAGYYRQPERTAAVLEKSGWLHTEEVVERCPDGSFRRIASLRPHHATTSNGHCVDLELLEALYAQHPLCVEGGVCVLVHPYRRYLCALVLTDEHRLRDFLQTTAAAAAAVPSPQSQSSSPTSPLPSSPSPHSLLNWAAFVEGNWPQCLGDPALNHAAAASLVAWASRHGNLASHERVRHVRVLYDVWDAAHHTRTATGRLLRAAIHYRYRGLIQELFADED